MGIVWSFFIKIRQLSGRVMIRGTRSQGPALGQVLFEKFTSWLVCPGVQKALGWPVRSLSPWLWDGWPYKYCLSMAFWHRRKQALQASAPAELCPPDILPAVVNYPPSPPLATYSGENLKPMSSIPAQKPRDLIIQKKQQTNPYWESFHKMLDQCSSKLTRS